MRTGNGGQWGRCVFGLMALLACSDFRGPAQTDEPPLGPCIPNCGGAVCGEDGCGGVCGTCPHQASCEAGVCVMPVEVCDGGPCVPPSPGCDGGSCDAGCEPLPHGLVTIQFDDGRAAQYTLARQPLLDHGMKASLFFITQNIEQQWTGYLTLAQAQALAADGHEIGSHTVSHENLTQLTTEQIEEELTASKQWLETNFGVAVEHMASPFGAYDERVVDAANRHYQSHGTVETGLNFPGADLFRLKRYTVTASMTPAQIHTLVQQARSSRGWLILLFHDFSSGTPANAYTYAVSDFVTVLDELAASGLEVVTTQQGVARVRCR